MQRLDRFQNTAVVSHESFNKTILRVGAETLLMAIFISSCNLCLHYGQKNIICIRWKVLTIMQKSLIKTLY